jgi:hypothetical protein
MQQGGAMEKFDDVLARLAEKIQIGRETVPPNRTAASMNRPPVGPGSGGRSLKNGHSNCQ